MPVWRIMDAALEARPGLGPDLERDALGLAAGTLVASRRVESMAAASARRAAVDVEDAPSPLSHRLGLNDTCCHSLGHMTRCETD